MNGLEDTLSVDPPGLTSLSDRYDLGAVLGRGAYGEVRAATDRLSGQRVAIKVMRDLVGADLGRARREIAALRCLQLPGVVQLLDDGVDRGRLFLVMQLVEGRPFPGRPDPVDWETVSPTVRALLETLSLVHDSGIVHRDIKPANVLVDDRGRPTVLDFGLAKGDPAGIDITATGQYVGTPAYLAPEQVGGARLDARADLYSLGVMLYEVLAGQRPHVGASFEGILRSRLGGPPPRLLDLAPGVPHEVARVVDALLATEPDARPASCREVLSRLFDLGPTTHVSGRWAPLVGREDTLRRIHALLDAGRSVSLRGPRGVGCTRLLTEVVEGARPARDACFTRNGVGPLSSIGSLLRGRIPPAEASLEEAEGWARRQVAAFLAQGGLVAVDHPERLDCWSRRSLEANAAGGGLLWSGPLPGAVEVEIAPLDAADLRGLFLGPDRVLHLREDAADELHRRTGGLPGRVARELRGWARSGLGTFDEDGRFVIERVAVERLRADLRVPGSEAAVDRGPVPVGGQAEMLAWLELAWPSATVPLLVATTDRPRWRVEADLEALVDGGWARRLAGQRYEATGARQELVTWPASRRAEAHRRLAEAMPVTEASRFRHLVAWGQPGPIIEAALELAARARQQGTVGRAEAALSEAVAAVRREGLRPGAVLHARLELAFQQSTERALEAALHDLRAAGAAPVLCDLAEGALRAWRSGGAGVVRSLGELPALPTEDLELRRQAARVVAARSADLEVERRLIEELEGWAAGRGGAAQAALAGWRGGLLYRRGRFEEAAEEHLRSASERATAPGQMSARLNAASALLEARHLERARREADSVRLQAAELRHPLFEGRAEVLIRMARYRGREATAPDRELPALVERLGLTSLWALGATTEAAVAWRTDHPARRELAEDAARAWGQTGRSWARLLAGALRIACGRPTDPLETAALLEGARGCPSPEIGAQIAGLLGCAGAVEPKEVGALARQLLGPRAEDDGPMDILSPRECVVAQRLW